MFNQIFIAIKNCGQYDICFGNSSLSNSNILSTLEQCKSNIVYSLLNIKKVLYSV